MTPNEQNPPGEPAPITDSTQPQSASALSTGHSRRVFLFKLSLYINAIVGAIVAVPIIGYLLGPAKKDPSLRFWVNLGPLSNFPENETRLVDFRNPVTTAWDGQTANIPCWVRRTSGSTFQVFAINCAHLGCPVRWFAQSQLFLCPCHGGAYYADGARASGPPERGLFEYSHRIDGGSLMVDVGKMPTLAAQAQPKPPLTQIEGSPAAKLAAVEQPKPRCSSCPT
jgi:menaquinol-cytochrome c reductase iron-sulfur subunit